MLLIVPWLIPRSSYISWQNKNQYIRLFFEAVFFTCGWTDCFFFNHLWHVKRGDDPSRTFQLCSSFSYRVRLCRDNEPSFPSPPPLPAGYTYRPCTPCFFRSNFIINDITSVGWPFSKRIIVERSKIRVSHPPTWYVTNSNGRQKRCTAIWPTYITELPLENTFLKIVRCYVKRGRRCVFLFFFSPFHARIISTRSAWQEGGRGEEGEGFDK